MPLKRIGFRPVFVWLLCLAALAPAQAAPSGADDELVGAARRFLDALNAGDFVAATRDFDAAMLQMAGPDKLAEFWKMAPAQLGVFVKQGGARRESLGAYEIVLINCQFANQTLDARLVFDKERKIAGFQFVPPAATVAWRPPAYADPGLFTETEVVVGTGEWELPGTLTMPRGTGPFPALVLVHGSGPNDRDETIGPNKTFKDLAWGLASRGMAVLRYEKRTRMYGARLVSDAALAAAFTVRSETVDDALAAVRLLRAAPRVAADRVFVLGHSLGGMLVPRIAAESDAAGVAGFIIMAGLTRRLDETMLEQLTYLAGLDGVVSADEQARLASVRGDLARIRALQPGAALPAQTLLFAPPAYWLDLRDYDPATAARKVRQPLLVLQGGRDYQVTGRDFAAWKVALRGRRDVEFKYYPRLNHLFFAAAGPPGPDEYMRGNTNVAEQVVRDIAGWLKKMPPARRNHGREN